MNDPRVERSDELDPDRLEQEVAILADKANINEECERLASHLEQFGGALGVVVGDFDSDGWPDIYVANDGVANQLWMNEGDGTFRDEAMLAGVGVNMDGSPEASMGVDAADFDGDGDEDLFMTHLARETNTLYINDGEGWFEDRTLAMGLANPSFQYTGFGTAWFDYDNDGWLDILAVNGAVTRIEEQMLAGEPFPLRQLGAQAAPALADDANALERVAVSASAVAAAIGGAVGVDAQVGGVGGHPAEPAHAVVETRRIRSHLTRRRGDQAVAEVDHRHGETPSGEQLAPGVRARLEPAVSPRSADALFLGGG